MSEKARKPRSTPQQKRLIEAVKAGAVLTKTFEEGETVYGLEGVGHVNKRTVSLLLERGLLRERADAMFGIGQTLECATTL